MSKFILGRKMGMSEWWNEKKEMEAVTLVDCQGLIIVGQRNIEKDKYSALILGLIKKNKQGTNLDKKFLDSKNNFNIVCEYPLGENTDKQTGDKVLAEIFTAGDNVKVAGISKGKGFQGVVKRHNFAGGPKSHGHRHVLRSAGSIGSAFPEHVRKGKKMAGRMGNSQVTVKNLKVSWVDKENNIIAIRGAIPGRRGGIVKIIAG